MSKAKTERIDVCGQVCPSTLLLTLREVNRRKDELHAGTLCLEVRTDNRHATMTIPNTVRSMGLGVRVHREDDGGYLIEIGAEKD